MAPLPEAEVELVGEILRVIASSPADVQPVFDAIAERAARVCGARIVAVFRVEHDLVHVVAQHDARPAPRRDVAEELRRYYPQPLAASESLSARAIVEGRVVHVADLESEPGVPDVSRQLARGLGYRGVLSVPMICRGAAVGTISVARAEAGRFSETHLALLRAFADAAVIAVENARLITELEARSRSLATAFADQGAIVSENVRLFNELQTRNRDLTEALEQQTATAEILRVISSSPKDLQPVLNAVSENASRLCEASDAVILLLEGGQLRTVAHHGRSFAAAVDRPATRDGVAGRAVLDRETIHLHDVLEAHDFPLAQQLSQADGSRTVLATPLLREGGAIGAILIRRREVRPFSDKQTKLLKTFADQAVIAIENVRLFTELQEKNRALTQAHAQVTESLEQQTATSEILRVISQSPTDVQPVFETLLRNAVRLCHAVNASLYRFDGQLIHLVANHNLAPDLLESWRRRFPRNLSEGGQLGEVLTTSTVLRIADVFSDEGAWSPPALAALRSMDAHCALLVPILQHGKAIGVIALFHRQVGAFTDTHVALLQTFADQVVIAIENVRLFKELEARNRDLTEALEQQTATSEILKVISSSPTDLQPVFETIARNTARLCGDGSWAIVTRYDGQLVHLVAQHNARGDAADMERLFPIPLSEPSSQTRAILERSVVHVPDVEQDNVLRERARTVRSRSLLTAPLLRDGEPIGSISASKATAGAFSDGQIALLKTFGDQAVIAIENVRLFKELEDKNRALTAAHQQVSESLERQTATSEVLRAIAHTQTDVQPVFDTIVESATRLCHAAFSFVFLTEGGMLYHPASYGTSREAVAAIQALFPRPLDRDTVAGTAILTRSVIHVSDVQDPSAGFEFARRTGQTAGYQSLLSVPMLRQGEALGAITVTRREPGRFSDAEVDLLQTFADQAVIAIENVRLFTELQARTADLTRSVEQLTALGEVGRALSSTLDLETVLTTIVSRAVQLSGLDGGVVFEYDKGAEEFVQRVATDTGALAEARRTTRIRKGEGVLGRTAITLEPVQVPDIAVPGAYEGRLRENLVESGIRAILAVPMVREDRLIGCLGVTRNRPGEFPAETIELLRTFATQSALAIQNARLFQEIEDKGRQLEAASQHKSEFLANMSHELRTPLNAVIGFSEVLAERMFGELNEKQEEYLKDIHASGQHLLSLINDILDLSKIEAGRMELELTDFNLPTTLDNALTLVRERAARHGIALHMSVDERLDQIRADERKFRQVVLNLLSNAIKFTPDGGRIEVRAVPVDGSVEVSVSDTGVGIAPEDQEAVFEEFRQVGTAAKKVEGTGLGLALSRKFVELHGGRIWVKSQVGVGSTFTFTLPLRAAPSSAD